VQLTGCAFLFMREKKDNSGSGQNTDFCDREMKMNANVKGVGQECPTHTGNVTNMEMIDLQAVAEDNCKRMGEAVEAAFLAKVCKMRIPVCKPWGDSERYDFVVDWGKGFWRVQVKGGSYCEGKKYQAGAGGKGKPFTKEDMDFVVVYIVPVDVWYVVPIEWRRGW
jgi:hypothetical protein